MASPVILENGSSVLKVFQVTTLYLAKIMCMACVVCGWIVSMVDSYWQETPKYSSEACPSDTFSVTNSRETEFLM
jgi:hypothetical protein